jgi:malate permease and related proteins
MAETLFQAYLPLLVWTGLGLISFRFLPDTFPRFLGRVLYWVGIPLEIFTLARQTNLAEQVGLAPFATAASLLAGMLLAWGSLKILRWRSPSRPATKESAPAGSLSLPDCWQAQSWRGSFILSAMLGNTGFIGLAIAPVFVAPDYLSWVVFFSVANNVLGTYGSGVALASYFGRDPQKSHWWVPLRDVLTVPSLWAFAMGSLTRSIALPDLVESGLHHSIWVVIPCALLLMGMRLCQLRGWKSLRLAIVPSIIKVFLVPGLVGIASMLLGLPAAARLALVLMAGMPTAFAGLILAEEYELDRELIASSIVLSTVMLLVTIPLWLLLFG